jgi:hypothetical protein
MSMAMTRAPISTASCVADKPTGPWPKMAFFNDIVERLQPV